MSERDSSIRCARVYIAQERHFRERGSASFAATLLRWAANRRRKAQAAAQEAQRGILVIFLEVLNGKK